MSTTPVDVTRSLGIRRHHIFRAVAFWAAVLCSTLSIIFRNAGFSRRFRYAVVALLAAWLVSYLVEWVGRRFVHPRT